MATNTPKFKSGSGAFAPGNSPQFKFSSAAAQQVGQLQAQIAAQQSKLAAQGGQVPQAHHPSLLERVMDVVSRPNYAMAGMFGHAYDEIAKAKASGQHLGLGAIPGAFASGALRGLEGKDKYHFSDVMQKAIQANAPGSGLYKNRVVRGVGGLAADILTDPLTYVGPGIEKGVAAAGIEGAGAASGAIGSTMGPGVKALDLENAANAARQAVTKPGALTLDVLGKPVLRSEGAYEALAKVGRPIAASGPVSGIRNAFSTAAQYPGQLNQFLRTGRQAGVAAFTDFDKSMTAEIASKLTKEEGSQVTRAIEQGVDLTGQVSKKGLDLGDAQKYWQDHHQGWSQLEQGLGIYRTGQGIDTHVPAFFPTASERKAYIEKFGTRLSQAAKAATEGDTALAAQKLPTLDEIAAAGLHPHTNIVDVLKMRGAQHWRDVAKAEFHHAAIAEYGVEIAGKGSKAAKQVADEQGLVELKKSVSPFVGERKVYVPPEVSDSMKRLNHFYASDEETGRILKQLDNVQRIWKAGVTTVNPGHHIRAMMGDVFRNYEAGVTNPADYTRAFKILHDMPGTVKIGDMSVGHDVLHSLYNVKGGAGGFFNTELVGSKLGKPLETLRDITSKRENWMRLANFTNAMREGGAETLPKTMADLDKLAETATARVRKYNFDFGDLTPTETALRRMVPFYTFMRKNVPLQMEMLALHPNKIAKIPQGLNAISQLLGTDPSHLPVSEIIPDYLKQAGAVRLRGESAGHQALYAALPNPVEDATKIFSGSLNDVLRKAVGQFTPPVRMMAELGFKKSAFSGAPIHGNATYLANQFGLSKNILDTLAPHQPNRVIRPGETTTPNPLYGWSNLLSGFGVKPITEQMQLSELKRQQAPVQTRLKSLRTQRINAALRGFKK